MSSASTSVWEKVASPAIALIPGNSVPPYMSLVTFELQLQCWSSERVSPRKSMCGPFKWNTWDSSCSTSHSVTIPAGFYSQKLWGILFLALKLWAGGPGVGLEPLDPQGDLHNWNIPPNFDLGMRLAHFASLPFPLVSMWLLFISLFIGLLFS